MKSARKQKAEGKTGRRAGGRKMIRSMPAEVQVLRKPWESLVGVVPGLTEELERRFQFGQFVGLFPSGYKIGGSIKGGSSMIFSPSNEEEYIAYEGWYEREGIPRSENREAFDRMMKILNENDVELVNLSSGSIQNAGYVSYRGKLYEVCAGVLELLPERHLSNKRFSKLQLGGWGPDSAKASAYDEHGGIIMYDFAIHGATRTFTGLFLHELGHAMEAGLSKACFETLAHDHRRLARTTAFLGVDYVIDARARRVYQQIMVDEFIAETYMIYTSQGERLRKYVRSLKDRDVREAWHEVYDLFLEEFDGIEYA